ncbi:helix-turn-helix domain-containing protein [Colwellia psychrerythraea]|uniref:Helix-turn-helix domain protein n=1 Tax=Colwellia psychrerythraea TaxID=28229 RepID=A0A099KJR0_COLPS|nr:helix-turn-helix transcriptional regulator [Colwellia psychrerythraea]KGJ89843.1 helix-turn-helix domain protein [Colwellia psychrerythraea]
MFIKNLRQVKYLSQEDLAALSGLSLRTIQRVESGHRVSYASLRSLAAAFDINVDELEQELYSMKNIIKEYTDYPFWLRLYLGSGWFTATRDEFKKTEVFYLIFAAIFAVIWLVTSLMDIAIYRIAMFGSICSFIGAYNISVTIRTGDKYDIWSKLESTLPKSWFSFLKRK